eukprot:2086919-Pyramimonas_sp.AAC.1
MPHQRSRCYLVGFCGGLGLRPRRAFDFDVKVSCASWGYSPTFDPAPYPSDARVRDAFLGAK